jgi:hypothetical protein
MIQGMIHDNIQVLKSALSGQGQSGSSFRTLAELGIDLSSVGLNTAGDADPGADPDADPRVGVRAVAYLSRINQSIIELGQSLTAGERGAVAQRVSAQAAA